MSAKILLFPEPDPTVPPWHVCPRWEDHEWEHDGYYGTGCKKCDIWFPEGGAPWDDPDEDYGYYEEYGEED